MAQTKVAYTKRATTYKEQIDILRQRGAIIVNEEKAKEYLLDIGYYRLGFYLHPFEISYPELDKKRKHDLFQGTKIEDAVALYYFDLDLRNILNKYLGRIEVAIRTSMIYELSNKYNTDPTWFVNDNIVSRKFINEFPSKAYNSISKKDPIKRHHKKYIGQYAPAWKTMEYMTLGNLEVLYENLLLDTDKRIISLHFGEPSIKAFQSYMATIREVRNACAHGNVLWRMRLTNGIRTGVACSSFPPNTHQTFYGALLVIDYLIKRVSINRANDMWEEIYRATNVLYSKAPRLKQLIEKQTGIILSANTKNNYSIIKRTVALIKKIIKYCRLSKKN